MSKFVPTYSLLSKSTSLKRKQGKRHLWRVLRKSSNEREPIRKIKTHSLDNNLLGFDADPKKLFDLISSIKTSYAEESNPDTSNSHTSEIQRPNNTVSINDLENQILPKKSQLISAIKTKKLQKFYNEMFDEKRMSLNLFY